MITDRKGLRSSRLPNSSGENDHARPNAELSRPQSFTSLQITAGKPLHKENIGPVQVGVAVSNAMLYRLASVAGAGSALILLVNAAKRSSLIPTTDLTQLLAPFAEVMALGLITGLFLAFGRRAGLFGTVAFIVNFTALASLVAVEVVINLVFSKLPMPAITELRARAAWDISHCEFSTFFAWHARVRSLSCHREGRTSPSARTLFHWCGANRAPCIRAGIGSRSGLGDPCHGDHLAGEMAVGTCEHHRRLQAGKRDHLDRSELTQLPPPQVSCGGGRVSPGGQPL